MAKILTLANIKGGVGKTTLSLNLGLALKHKGLKSVVVDGNVSKPNIALHLGAYNLDDALHEVLNGDSSIHDVIYTHPSGLQVIPTNTHSSDPFQNHHYSTFVSCLQALKSKFDVVLVDSAPGHTREALAAIHASDGVIVPTTPDWMSVTDALKTIHIAQAQHKEVMGTVLNRMSEHRHDLSEQTVEHFTGVPFLGSVSEHTDFKEALGLKMPLMHSHPRGIPSQDIGAIAEKLAAQLKNETDQTNN